MAQNCRYKKKQKQITCRTSLSAVLNKNRAASNLWFSFLVPVTSVIAPNAYLKHNPCLLAIKMYNLQSESSPQSYIVLDRLRKFQSYRRKYHFVQYLKYTVTLICCFISRCFTNNMTHIWKKKRFSSFIPLFLIFIPCLSS